MRESGEKPRAEGRHDVCFVGIRMDAVAEELKARTKRFAVAVLELAETMSLTAGAEAVKRQMIRAALGVVGNYRSACRARSHAEFTSRMGIVLDESDEAELWLDVVTERRLSPSKTLSSLLDESRQLRAIFSKAYQTARKREQAERSTPTRPVAPTP